MREFVTEWLNEERLPLVVRPKGTPPTLDALCALLREESSALRKQTTDCGSILLRGFPIAGASDFKRVVDALDFGKPLNYLGGDSPRVKLNSAIYTSTEAPASVPLLLHNEMSYARDYPSHLYFHCEIAPQARGETTIGDGRKILADIDQRVTRRFEERRLKYIARYYANSKKLDLLNRFMQVHRTWMDALETQDPGEAERICKEAGNGYRWLRDQWLQVEWRGPVTRVHPATGEQVWFNQVHLFDFSPRFIGWLNYLASKVLYSEGQHSHEVMFEDDAPIPPEDMNHVMDVLEKRSIYFPLQKGDVMILDNVLVMHGRAAFSGPRRILVAMTK